MMNHARGLVCCCVAVLLTAITSVGCDKSAPTAASTAPASPEESFKFIMATLRRGLETASSGVLTGGRDGGYTALSVNNKISEEYLPPVKDGEPHRARITIDSESQVTIQPGGGDRRADQLDGDDEGGATGTDSLDPVTIRQAAQNANRQTTPGARSDVPVARPNKVTISYELIHQNGRWELVNPIDREKDQAAFEAFDYALKTQL